MPTYVGRAVAAGMLFAALAFLPLCARAQVSGLHPDVQLVTDEADAALEILRARAAHSPPPADAWTRLFSSAGYTHLKERETAMRRAFTDSTFAAFLESDTLLARYPALARSVAALEHAELSRAAARALAYLPAGTSLRARMYLEIKPFTNTFVFTGRDSIPSIFLYVDTKETPAQLENTLAHELHHIGLNAACPDHESQRGTPAQQMLARFLGGFGEGQAMLAAAGSPDVHPHSTDDDSIRARWDRDVANAPADMAALSRFFTAVLDGRIASPDSVRSQAMTYYGIQGPWYTVGWLMASTVERERGRAALVRSLCTPARFMALYNEAALTARRRGVHLPLWDPALLRRLARLE
jgi:hypothetical protein